MEVNLISDTDTRPTEGMLKAMFSAEVGDDVFRKDPTVNKLEHKIAEMFGKQAAIFCPSGTMTNQIAIKVHTRPLDEIICDVTAHIYQYEGGGYAFNSGVSVHLLDGKNGKFTAQMVESGIKPKYDWLPRTSLVVIENTSNKGGGTIFSIEEIDAIKQVCSKNNLRLHLDGARIFNALVETGDSTESIGSRFDTISVCLSKGLGAPVGSVLIGDKDVIDDARRIRKVLGGGMRQAGYLAAAGIYALDHHIPLLKVDNQRAKRIGEILLQKEGIKEVRPVNSNLVIFDLKEGYNVVKCAENLAKRGILCMPFGPQTIRMVTHLNITDEMMTYLEKELIDFPFGD
jgi:threonine aldolase